MASDILADDAETGPADDTWQAVRPRTMVDEAVEAIMAGAARGLILPGDRIVETEISQALKISRVPVREALRILESQGVVTSEPYKGIRLMPVTRERLEQVLEVRVALEKIAARSGIERGMNTGPRTARLSRAIDELELMQARGDAYGFANADTAFHRELCRLGGNEVLCTVWESLGRQLTIIFGLSTLGKRMSEIVEEHRHLLRVFSAGDPAKMDEALEEHILEQPKALDFSEIIAHRRGELTQGRPRAPRR